jgi:Phosphotransferase enzyme family
MFAHLRDPAMPALQTLTPEDLARITGTPGTRLLRARYQPGARAVLHVALAGGSEGSVWFFAGTKAQSLARKMPHARLDAASGALFESFPQDHRLPQMARFVAEAATLASRLVGGPIAGPPHLLRYRPGLSATFRVIRSDARVFYVKQTPGQDVQAQARMMADLQAATEGSQLGVARVAGLIPDLGLIAYAVAPGRPLDMILQDSGPLSAAGFVRQVTQGLQSMWSLPLRPSRTLDRSALLARSDQAARMIALLDPQAGRTAADMVAGLRDTAAEVRAMPVHADMKLEHAFLSGPMTTLIDIESLSLGDPDLDLAQLEARLAMAELGGMITKATSSAAAQVLRARAGPHYPWFATCARLQCARFFAQRFEPEMIPQMSKILSLS